MPNQTVASRDVLERMRVKLLPEADGSLPLCHIVAGWKGHPLSFRGLARQLADRRGLLGVSHPAFAGVTTRLRSIEDIAAAMDPAVRASGVKEPVLLVGYSLGGAIVYELGRRLWSDGIATGVVLVDTSVPTLRRRRLLQCLRRWVRQQTISFAGVRDLHPKRPEMSWMNWDLHFARYSYHPKASDMPIALLMSSPAGHLEGKYYHPDDTLGWRQVAPLVFQQECPGSHLDMFKDEKEQSFAAALDAALKALEHALK